MKNESGIITIMTAVLAVVLVAVAGLVSTYGYGLVVRSELQVAADSASLAGAAELCPSQECWDKVTATAAAALQAHIAHGNVGGSIELDIHQMNQRRDGNGNLVPIWDGDNLTVRIERGQWTKNFGFRSFEGNWEAEHPGVPKEIAMNSVRVTLERPRYSGVLDVFGGFASDISAASVATLGARERVRIAPLAIPVCSLLNAEGKFDRRRLCYADRLFTRADRYCEDGGDCGVIPSFSWTPCSPETQANFAGLGAMAAAFCGDIWSEQEQAPGQRPTEPGWNPISACSILRYMIGQNHGGIGFSSTPYGCYLQSDLNRAGHPMEAYATIKGFRNEQFASVSDHFGVFGAPGVSNPNEALIRDAIERNVNPGFDARIGDQFGILPEGLREPESQDALRSQILGSFGDNGHVAMSQTEIGTLNNYLSTFRLYDNPADPILSLSRSEAGGEIVPSYGICNSIRTELRCERDSHNPSKCARSFNGDAFVSQTLKPGISDESAVWRTLVAVIADTSTTAARCQNDAGGVDPKIEAGRQYEVIGFVSSDIFDSDIGATSPARIEPTFSGPWGFIAEDGSNQCNLVRARTSCSNNFVATTDPTAGRRHPSLAEGPGPLRYDDMDGGDNNDIVPS